MASKHVAAHACKAASAVPSAIVTESELRKAIVLGAAQGVARKAGGGIAALILWGLRNII